MRKIYFCSLGDFEGTYWGAWRHIFSLLKSWELTKAHWRATIQWSRVA